MPPLSIRRCSSASQECQGSFEQQLSDSTVSRERRWSGWRAARAAPSLLLLESRQRKQRSILTSFATWPAAMAAIEQFISKFIYLPRQTRREMSVQREAVEAAVCSRCTGLINKHETEADMKLPGNARRKRPSLRNRVTDAPLPISAPRRLTAQSNMCAQVMCQKLEVALVS